MDYFNEYTVAKAEALDLYFYADPELSHMTLGDLLSAGYDDGYNAGIDRGMELQRKADEQLRKEGLLETS